MAAKTTQASKLRTNWQYRAEEDARPQSQRHFIDPFVEKRAGGLVVQLAWKFGLILAATQLKP